jgi:hypothetical protein
VVIKTIGKRRREQAAHLEIEDIVMPPEESRVLALHLVQAIPATTPTERALKFELLQTRRELDVARARVSVLMMGGDKNNMTRPVATAFEREKEFTRRVLALGGMTAKAQAREIKKLVAEVEAYEEQRERYLADVEANTVRLLDKE